ncbi:MAG: hypothetical protein ABS81_10675 [Pseudonocardia sp. SCN 72-86]|nr:MAG: hypothetical protein ABS81_10675 [Pseudonocardia sp. SCN 72-86]
MSRKGAPIDVVVLAPGASALTWDDLVDLRRPVPIRTDRPGGRSWLAAASSEGRVLGYLHARRSPRSAAHAAEIRHRWPTLDDGRRSGWLIGGLEIAETAVAGVPDPGSVLETMLCAVERLAVEGRSWAAPGPHETRFGRTCRGAGWVEVLDGLLLHPGHPAVRFGEAFPGCAVEPPLPWSSWPAPPGQRVTRPSPRRPGAMSLELVEIL